MSLTPRLRRNALIVVGLLVSAAALWLVLRSIDLADTGRILTQASPIPVVAIVGVVALQVVVRTLRWSIVLPVQDATARVPVQRLVPPLLAGYLGNAILPARLGEAMRAVIVSRRERVGFTEALGSVLLERVVDVATLAPIALVAAILVGAPAWAVQILIVAAAGGGLIVAILSTVGIEPVVRLADRVGLSRRPGIRSLAERFASSVGGASRRPAILLAVVLSSLAWLLDATSFWLAAQAVGVEVGYGGAMLVSGITVLGTAVPSAPGYVGTFELAAASVAGALGASPEAALAMAVVVHAMTLLPMALGGALSMVLIGADLGEVAHAASAEGSRS